MSESGPGEEENAWNSLAAGILVCLLAWLGLAFSIRTNDPILVKTAGAWFAVGLAFLALAFAPAVPRQASPSAVDSWATPAFLSYGVLCLLSPRPWLARVAFQDAALVLLAYIAARRCWRPRMGQQVAWTLAAASSIALAMGVAFSLAPGLFGISVRSHQGVETRALMATMGNPDYFAAWLLAAFPFTVRLAARSSGLAQQLARCTIFLELLALLLTLSRSAWLGLAAELVLLKWLYRAERVSAPLLSRQAWLGIGLSALVIGAGTGTASKLLNTATLGQRAAIWKGALDMAADRPWAGQGPGSFGAAFPLFRSPDFRELRLNYVNDFGHDWPLHALATCGVPGLLLVLAGALALALDTLRSPTAGRIALAGALVHDLFSVTLCVTPLAVLAALLLADPDAACSTQPKASLPLEKPRPPKPSIFGRLVLSGLALACFAGLAAQSNRKESDRLLRQAREVMERAVARGESPAPAAPLLERALDRTPFDSPARYRLAATRAFAGELPDAQAAYVLLEAAAGPFAELPRDRAEVYRLMGRIDASRLQSAHWIDMNRRDSRSHVLAATIEEAAGDRVRAREMARQALKLDPLDPAVTRLITDLGLQ